MRDYIVKRLIAGLLLVISVSFLVFSLMYMMPGDPVDMVISQRVSEERKAQIAHELGFDKPFLVQYKNWVVRVFNKDFGTSIKYRTPVLTLFKSRIPYSLRLCGWSIILEMIIALPLGLYCAVHKDSFMDKLIVNTSLIFTAIPAFWMGALFIILFAVRLKILPISGYSTPLHYVLPVVTITLGSLGSTIKITKAEVLEVLNEKYVITAYAKGLPRQKVLYKHVLRNALIIVVTILFMSLPWMITGAVITEKIFGMPGMGQLLVNSIIDQDIQVVQAVLLIIAVLTVLCNLASDLITAVLDPRIRVTMNGGEE